MRVERTSWGARVLQRCAVIESRGCSNYYTCGDDVTWEDLTEICLLRRQGPCILHQGNSTSKISNITSTSVPMCTPMFVR